MRYLWALLLLLLMGGGMSSFFGDQHQSDHDRPVVDQPSIPVVPESSGAGTTVTGLLALAIAATAMHRLRGRD